MRECGAPGHPPRHTHQRCIREHPLPRPCPPPSSSPCHCFADFSTLSKTVQRSPRPTPTLGGIGDRRLACSVPRVQPALSCRCPSRSKRPRHVGPHKRPPTSGAPRLPLLPRGVPGPRSGARGQLLGVGTLPDKGLARGPSRVRAGLGRSWGARARAPSGVRAARARARDALPRTGAPGGIRGLGGAADSAAPPPQPPAQLRRRSGETQLQGAPFPSAPGPPRCAPHSPPRDPCGPPPPSAAQKEPPNTPGGGSPSLLPWLRARPPWGRRHPTLRAPLAAPDPGGAEQRNKPKVTDLSLQRARALPTEAAAAAAAAASRGGPGAPATRSARRARRAAGRARGARRLRLPPRLPARSFGRRPTCPPPSALPVGHRR